MAEHINAEISLNAITSLESTIKYIQGTFLFVRMKKNLKYYVKENTNVNIETHVQNLCREILEELGCYDLISYDKIKRDVKPLELGIEMSRFYVDFLSVKVLFENYQNKLDSHFANLQKLVETLSKAHEYEKFRSKLEERSKLK